MFCASAKKFAKINSCFWNRSINLAIRNYCVAPPATELTDSPRTNWSTVDVVTWAKNYVGDEAIKVLEGQEIDGEALLRISQQDLERWGMKGGPASKIIAALKPDSSLEHWQQLLKALGTVTPTKVDWKGDPAKDPNLHVLTLPNDLEWPTLESPHLYIRARYNCYERIWTEIEQAYLKRARHQGPLVEFARALIQGNSGIGKTAFLNYALYRAVKQGYPVLFETKKHRIFFHGDKVEYEDIVMMEKHLKHHQDERNVLVLHDHNPQTEPPIISGGAFVIAPVSPDARNSDQFRRDKCLEFCMPLPTRQELEAMNSIELRLPSKSLGERINLFGPVTRICLSASPKEYEKYKKLLTSRIQSFRYKDLAPILRATSLPTTQVHGLSWWIIHLDTTESLDDFIISWASPQILEEVTQITDKAPLSDLEDGVAEQLLARTPPLPTFEYQKWATYKLAQGMDISLRYFATDGSLEPSESLHLSKSEVRRDYFYKISLEDLKSQPTKLFSSSNPNAVLCDLATIAEDATLYLFQATIGLVHSLNLKFLKELAEEAKKLEVQRVRLIYIVPDVEVFRLKPKDLVSALEYIKESGLDIKIAVAELKPHSARPNSLLDNRS
jgi:hypothetical protein